MGRGRISARYEKERVAQQTFGDRARAFKQKPDLQIDTLSRPRLKRLAAKMKLSGLLAAWLSDHARFHASEDVRNNASTVLGF